MNIKAQFIKQFICTILLAFMGKHHCLLCFIDLLLPFVHQLSYLLEH